MTSLSFSLRHVSHCPTVCTCRCSQLSYMRIQKNLKWHGCSHTGGRGDERMPQVYARWALRTRTHPTLLLHCGGVVWAVLALALALRARAAGAAWTAGTSGIGVAGVSPCLLRRRVNCETYPQAFWQVQVSTMVRGLTSE